MVVFFAIVVVIVIFFMLSRLKVAPTKKKVEPEKKKENVETKTYILYLEEENLNIEINITPNKPSSKKAVTINLKKEDVKVLKPD